MTKKRIIAWIITLIIACGLNVFSTVIASSNKEKANITVCASEKTKPAFERALNYSELKGKYKIVMTTNPNSNLVVTTQKEENSTRIAFSPFVAIYGGDEKLVKQLNESDVFVQSEYCDDYNINLFKIIEEVSQKDGLWSDFGIEGFSKIKVFYPSQNSMYWESFYNLMLISVNGGKYPKDDKELENAVNIVNQFIDSDCTEAVDDFVEKVQRVGGTPGNVFFIIPENLACELCKQNYDITVYYPINTTYFSYYIKGDELGNKLIKDFNVQGSFLERSFYTEFTDESYCRTIHCLGVPYNSSSNISGLSDIYNVVEAPE